MGYVGPEPKLGRNREVDDISSSFNGNATAFTLQVGGSNVSPGSANDIIVSLGGVVQNPNTDYTVAASTLTFTTAPASGLGFFAVVLGQGIDSDVATPSDRSVNAAKLTDPLVLPDNQKIIFGTSSDGLEIFHDTTGTEQSVIKDSGTGQLLIQGENTIAFTNVAGNENYLRMVNNESVELFENGVKKFETAPGGVALTGGAAANIATVTPASSVTLDLATACHHKITLNQNTTFASPSNIVEGQSGSIFITQPSSGNTFTGQFNTIFKFAGGSTPTLTTTNDAVDRVDYVVFASDSIHCAVSLDVKR